MRTIRNQPLVLLVLSLLLIAGFVAIEACRKMDRPSQAQPELLQEKFFSIKPGTDATVIALVDKIKRQNAIRGFVPRLIKKAGMPVWEKAEITRSTTSSSNRLSAEEEQQVFIPFVVDSVQQTKAILAVKLEGDDTLFRMLYTTQYQQDGFDTTVTPGIWSAQEVFAVFTYFDNAIYGHTKFNIRDSRIMGTSTDTITNDALYEIYSIHREASRISNPVARIIRPIVTYITYIHCGYCPGRMSNGDQQGRSFMCCNPSYEMHPVVFWINDEEGGGEYGWFDIPNNGGGSGDPTPCPGCDWAETNPCLEPDPNAPQVPCNDDWQPVPNAVDELFDVNQFDSVRIATEIEDSFPCVAKILSEDLYDINKIAQKGLREVFTVNQYNHTYFQLDYNLCGTNITGAANDHPDRIMLNGQQHFIDTISLNPCWLKQASRESVVATVVHETIHAYILWCFADYQRYTGSQPGYTIDSFFLRDNFSIYWEAYKNRPWDATFQHTVMANKFIGYMADVIYRWGNSSAPTALRQWVAETLAKGGLQGTSAWGQATGMTDTCTINQVVYWGKKFHDAPGSSTGFTGGSPCRTTYYNFRDSLQMMRADSCQ
jgi:hypothetical protein